MDNQRAHPIICHLLMSSSLLAAPGQETGTRITVSSRGNNATVSISNPPLTPTPTQPFFSLFTSN